MLTQARLLAAARAGAGPAGAEARHRQAQWGGRVSSRTGRVPRQPSRRPGRASRPQLPPAALPCLPRRCLACVAWSAHPHPRPWPHPGTRRWSSACLPSQTCRPASRPTLRTRWWCGSGARRSLSSTCAGRRPAHPPHGIAAQPPLPDRCPNRLAACAHARRSNQIAAATGADALAAAAGSFLSLDELKHMEVGGGWGCGLVARSAVGAHGGCVCSSSAAAVTRRGRAEAHGGGRQGVCAAASAAAAAQQQPAWRGGGVPLRGCRCLRYAARRVPDPARRRWPARPLPQTLPFELRALEAALLVVTQILAHEVAALESTTHPGARPRLHMHAACSTGGPAAAGKRAGALLAERTPPRTNASRSAGAHPAQRGAARPGAGARACTGLGPAPISRLLSAPPCSSAAAHWPRVSPACPRRHLQSSRPLLPCALQLARQSPSSCVPHSTVCPHPAACSAAVRDAEQAGQDDCARGKDQGAHTAAACVGGLPVCVCVDLCARSAGWLASPEGGRGACCSGGRALVAGGGPRPGLQPAAAVRLTGMSSRPPVFSRLPPALLLAGDPGGASSCLIT